MIDCCPQRFSRPAPSFPGPLREGRAARQQHRQHPYRRADHELHIPRLISKNYAANGKGNGQVATLQQDGATGHQNGDSKEGIHISLPDVQRLLGQVADGEVDPQAAAVQVHAMGDGLQQVASLAASNSWGQNGAAEEIVWAPGKNAPQIAITLQKMAQEGRPAMAARVSPEVAKEVEALLPEVKYNAAARALLVAAKGKKSRGLPGTVAIISDAAGEDAVVEEAKAASGALGCYAYRLGSVAANGGLGSILANLPAVQSAAVVIVVAREQVGLPAVISGLVPCPVVAVPTSAAKGVVASAPGVSVVNSDNGVAAAIFAARILKAAARLPGPSP